MIGYLTTGHRIAARTACQVRTVRRRERHRTAQSSHTAKAFDVLSLQRGSTHVQACRSTPERLLS
eukprot:2698932-Rhodomonas_salina.2